MKKTFPANGSCLCAFGMREPRGGEFPAQRNQSVGFGSDMNLIARAFPGYAGPSYQILSV
jgi:hypothetical protein